MTLAQFSREESLRYQGWEEGIAEERRKTEAERRKTEAEKILGMRNMVETYFNFNQPEEAAKAAVAKKYPDMSDEFITSIISEIYGG